jgi:hypothetical protein
MSHPLTCLEFTAGKLMWRDRSAGSDGRLYVRNHDALLVYEIKAAAR